MCTQLRTCILAAMIIAFIGISIATVRPDLGWVTVAYADDHEEEEDEDDDDDDDDEEEEEDQENGNGDDGSSEAAPNQPNRWISMSAANNAPASGFLVLAEAEIVALGLRDEDVAILVQRGYRVIESRIISTIGGTSTRLGVPEGVGLEEARDAVQGLRPEAVADYNHFFRTEQAEPPCTGQHCMQFDLIKITPDHDARTSCGSMSVIGVIDTGINSEHKTFANSRLEVSSGIAEGQDASRAQHGTAIAALLIGDPQGRSPGLLPGARVLAIDTFHRAGRDERSDAYSLVQAMDRLANDGAQVINMSLAGPPSALVEHMVEVLTERGIIIVAAAGNGGPNSEPVFPAAYDQVIAVTAIDRHAGVYRRAARGPHIDFAAPGVDVWTAASISGARFKTGTSFAVPFVSAAVAVLAARYPELSPSEIAQKLAESARDLGEEGHDDIYGHGLIQLQDFCQ